MELADRQSMLHPGARGPHTQQETVYQGLLSGKMEMVHHLGSPSPVPTGLHLYSYPPRLPSPTQVVRPRPQLHMGPPDGTQCLPFSGAQFLCLHSPDHHSFLQGYAQQLPLVTKLPSSWDLNVALSALTKPVFKPLVTCSLSQLSMKVIFLVAITSARHINELVGMMAISSYTIFPKDEVFLCLHPKFIPQVVSAFHLNQCIHLLIFYPKSHISNRAIALSQRLPCTGLLPLMHLCLIQTLHCLAECCKGHACPRNTTTNGFSTAFTNARLSLTYLHPMES